MIGAGTRFASESSGSVVGALGIGTGTAEGPWQRVGTTPAVGASIGADALQFGAHRLTVTATITHAFQAETIPSYTSMWISVGYRFWNG